MQVLLSILKDAGEVFLELIPKYFYLNWWSARRSSPSGEKYVQQCPPLLSSATTSIITTATNFNYHKRSTQLKIENSKNATYSGDMMVQLYWKLFHGQFVIFNVKNL